MAWLRPRPGTTLSEADLRDYCRARMATFKVPKYWRLTEQFPMTVTGKVQKFRLREMAVEVLGAT